MAGMDIDSPSSESEEVSRLSPHDRIVERLVLSGIPYDVLKDSQVGLVSFIKENRSLVAEVVSRVLPTEDDVTTEQVVTKAQLSGDLSYNDMDEFFSESMCWLKWLMFEAEPQSYLNGITQKDAGKRAVCAAVWGHNDLAYRCRTCEHDPTCAICVPCFQNGNHKDHDYSIIYTGGGCCDCGDVTAWKREGFCSKHKGTEEIQPLNDELAKTMGDVLAALFVFWKDKMLFAELARNRRSREQYDVYVKYTERLCFNIVETLLDFSKCSESLLCFISKRMFECVGLLDVLVRAEKFFTKEMVKKLHELLLKLLSDPLFKYEFSKVFTRYYPAIVNEIIKESSDTVFEKYQSLSIFSVQIFTVPTLTPRLVREVNLLGVLLGCLTNLFDSCTGQDGNLQASKWGNLDETTLRLIEDIRYVLSHEEVPKYVCSERPDILRTWLKLLTLVQGMDAQKRVTGSPIEEENEHLSAPFMLGHFLGNVHTHLVQGAFSTVGLKEKPYIPSCVQVSEGLDEIEDQRYSKVGRMSQESSVCSIGVKTDGLECETEHSNLKSNLCIPTPAISLITECLRSIDGWLCLDAAKNNSYSFDARNDKFIDMLSFRRKTCRIKNDTSGTKACEAFLSGKGADHSQQSSSNKDLEKFDSLEDDMHPEYTYPLDTSNDKKEAKAVQELDAFGMLNRLDWVGVTYDVSAQEISFHIPLHQLLSLLLREAMKSCYGDIEKLASSFSLCRFDFFGHVLGEVQPFGFSSLLLEHPLRLRVFCAQVRAGMWRRNGDAALLSCEFYRSTQWFKHGIESDLFLLQCCAALAPPEFFVERVQERFGLSNYSSLNLRERNEYEAVLVQEMLVLFIHIVKERRFSGLSMFDNLKREIVRKLAVGDVTHSQLVKSLPRDLAKSAQLQNAVDTIAFYAKPSGMKQGKYSLRKAYWRELDLYHPCWSYRDLQVAEERYYRFCKVSPFNVQLPRWTNIFEPLNQVAKIVTTKAVFQILHSVFFYATFMEGQSVSRAPDGVLITALHLFSLALDICGQSHNRTTSLGYKINPLDHTNDLDFVSAYALEEFNLSGSDESDSRKRQSIIGLLVSLMRKHKKESDNTSSELNHCNIASLIDSLLKKFAEVSPQVLVVLKELAPEVVSAMPGKIGVQGLASVSASSSDAEERRARARARQAAIMEKMKADQSRFLASLKSADNSETGTVTDEESNVNVYVSEESTRICSLCRDSRSSSPLCFLILLQKSKLTTLAERDSITWEVAAETEKEILSNKSEDPDNLSDIDSSSLFFLAQNEGVEFPFDVEPTATDSFLGILRERVTDARNSQVSTMDFDSDRDASLLIENIENNIYLSVIEDVQDTRPHLEILDSDQKHSPHVPVSSRKGRSTEFSLLGEYVASLSRESKRMQRLGSLGSASMQSTTSEGQVSGLSPSDCDGVHISSCGHAVHQECHNRYLLSLKQRHLRRLGFEGGHIVDPDLGELLCPICRRFANCILPAFPGVSDKGWRRTSLIDSPGSSTLTFPMSDPGDNSLHLPLALSLLHSASKRVGEGKIVKALSQKLNENINPALDLALQKLYSMYSSPTSSNFSARGRRSHSLILWDTVKYTTISAEIAARVRLYACSENSNSCFESLSAELNSSSGYVLSLLLHIVQSVRSFNRLEVLMRFRGLQLLAGSILYGVSLDSNSSNLDKWKGILSTLTACGENGEAFPDIQFWKMAADPVLSQDPFSSLMWVIFSLPLPIIHSSDFFIALVHLFYLVCVIQVMIACYCKESFDTSSFGSCRLHDVCKRMSASGLARQYFVSRHVDPNCNPKDMVRRLTFPYLRRCALLLKLLKSSTLALQSQTFGGSTFYMNPDELTEADHLSIELKGISEIEAMFKICSLDSLLQDEMAHALALRWSDHFCEVLEVRSYRGILSFTPALPFKLVELPYIYQDLLQRYVKQQCSSCGRIPEEPTLCLLCGNLCSPNWKSCCRDSKCSIHAGICGAGIGVFLLVRKTTILLQRSARQAFWPSLYLDAFGEEDLDMHRGKPLYLSKERYAALTYLVASHGLDRSSEVLRQTSINPVGLE